MKERTDTQSNGRVDKQRLRPVRIIGLLLFLQGLLLFAIAAHQGLQVDWDAGLVRDLLSPQALDAITASGFFASVGVLAVVAAVGFTFVRSGAWLVAMVVQGLCLLSCVTLHFRDGPAYIYIPMAYSVLMVLYINAHNIRVVFDTPEPLEEIRG